MTRFERELSGDLGAFWKANAEKELKKMAADLAEGRITIDENGVARNCIGRILMSDAVEKLAHLTDKVSIEATKAARAKETERTLADYRANSQGCSSEERAGMRAAFGRGETVVNILTGERIRL